MVSLLSRVNTPGRAATFLYLLMPVFALLLQSGEVLAVDGNYASPYASQYDSRSTGASVPGITWLGLLLLFVNATAAAVFAFRHRRRDRA